MARLRSRSRIIHGEAVGCDDNGAAVVNRVRYRHHDESIFLYAFDLIELNRDDLRPDSLEGRKATIEGLGRMTATSLNFALLDANRPEVARLIAAMVQARDAVEHHSWSHPQQLTGEEWWADVLADPRARKREGHTDPQSSERIRLSKKCTLVREGCKSEAGGGGARRPFIMSDPSRRSCVQAKLKDLIERASSVADANLHRRKKPYPFGFAVRSNGSNFAFILDDTADNGQAIAQIKTLFLQHNVMSYVLAVAAISQGKQFVLFTAEDKSGLMVGHREIIVQPAFHLGPLEIIDSDVAEGPLVSLLPYQRLSA